MKEGGGSSVPLLSFFVLKATWRTYMKNREYEGREEGRKKGMQSEEGNDRKVGKKGREGGRERGKKRGRKKWEGGRKEERRTSGFPASSLYL
jgi:hypothetical protein